MAVKCYFWDTNGGKFGHVALKLSNGSYLSFRPKNKRDGTGQLVDAVWPGSKHDDCKTSGMSPRTYKLTSLDENKMWKQWCDLRGSKLKWDFIRMNCSTAIYLVLRDGDTYFARHNESNWTPDKLESIVSEYSMRARGTEYNGQSWKPQINVDERLVFGASSLDDPTQQYESD